MEEVHFFSQVFRGGTNVFFFVSEGQVAVFLAEIGWLEFQSMEQLVWDGFLNSKVLMVESELDEHLVSMNGILPSSLGNLQWVHLYLL